MYRIKDDLGRYASRKAVEYGTGSLWTRNSKKAYTAEDMHAAKIIAGKMMREDPNCQGCDITKI